jgi:hypothetical protein
MDSDVVGRSTVCGVRMIQFGHGTTAHFIGPA